VGFLTDKLFTAEVLLSAGETRETTRATVTLNGSRGRSASDPREIVGFVPMLVVAVMRALRKDPPLAAPYVAMCDETAKLLIDLGPAKARRLRLRDYANPDFAAERPGDQGAQLLAAGVPYLGPDPGRGPHRDMRADVKVPRSGAPFVELRGAGGFVAAIGTIAILEHVARTEDYESATVPMAGAVIRMLAWAEELNASPVPDAKQAVLLCQIADRLALEKDPLNFKPDSVAEAV
jgi:hypothetical protein